MTREAGIEAVAAQGPRPDGFALELADQFGFATDTPRDPARRGGHVGVHHPDARSLHAALVERKIVVDYRDPDVLRFGLSPLTTRFVDVYDAMVALAELVNNCVPEAHIVHATVGVNTGADRACWRP